MEGGAQPGSRWPTAPRAACAPVGREAWGFRVEGRARD